MEESELHLGLSEAALASPAQYPTLDGRRRPPGGPLEGVVLWLGASEFRRLTLTVSGILTTVQLGKHPPNTNEGTMNGEH